MAVDTSGKNASIVRLRMRSEARVRSCTAMYPTMEVSFYQAYELPHKLRQELLRRLWEDDFSKYLRMAVAKREARLFLNDVDTAYCGPHGCACRRAKGQGKRQNCHGRARNVERPKNHIVEHHEHHHNWHAAHECLVTVHEPLRPLCASASREHDCETQQCL